MEKKCEILRLNKENYSHLFADKEKSLDEYNTYIKTDLTEFKKFCDDKIINNVYAMENLEYDLRHEAVNLESDLTNLINSLSKYR